MSFSREIGMNWHKVTAKVLVSLLTFFVTMAQAQNQVLPLQTKSLRPAWVTRQDIDLKAQGELDLPLSEIKERFQEVLEKQKDLLSRGGPGLDGGGGVGILSSRGKLHFLDTAPKTEKWMPFDEESYRDIYHKFAGGRLSKKANLENSEEFFGCAKSILSAQKSSFLKFLSSQVGEFSTLTTELPLESVSSAKEKMVFTTQYGWYGEAVAMNSDQLLSPSLPAVYQRPMASFFRQNTDSDLKESKDDVLVVSLPLYGLLSPADQCALQIHELFRYLNNRSLSSKGRPQILRKALTTEEIQTFVRQIMAGKSIDERSLRFTRYARVLMKYGTEKALQLSMDQLEALDQQFDQSRISKDKMPLVHSIPITKTYRLYRQSRQLFDEFRNEMKKNKSVDVRDLWGQR